MKEKPSRGSTRMLECINCKYAQTAPVLGVTCGKALVGSTVTHNGELVHLCGCVMAIKTLIPGAKCPIGRWEEEPPEIYKGGTKEGGGQ